jgi:hypothetical protein
MKLTTTTNVSVRLCCSSTNEHIRAAPGRRPRTFIVGRRQGGGLSLRRDDEEGSNLAGLHCVTGAAMSGWPSFPTTSNRRLDLWRITSCSSRSALSTMRTTTRRGRPRSSTSGRRRATQTVAIPTTRAQTTPSSCRGCAPPTPARMPRFGSSLPAGSPRRGHSSGSHAPGRRRRSAQSGCPRPSTDSDTVKEFRGPGEHGFSVEGAAGAWLVGLAKSQFVSAGLRSIPSAPTVEQPQIRMSDDIIVVEPGVIDTEGRDADQ